MTPRILIELLSEKCHEQVMDDEGLRDLPMNLDYPLSAKQLMEISKAFNYFMAEQIQIAPCDHVGEFHYETIGGRYCGVCQRKFEKETVNG